MHIILPFMFIVTAMLVSGYVGLFAANGLGRTTGLALIMGAAFLVGGMLSANFNGGKPYGLDVPIGLERWKNEAKIPAQNYAPVLILEHEEKGKVDEDIGPPVA